MNITNGTWKLGTTPDSIVTKPTRETSRLEILHYGGKVIAESIMTDSDRYLISAAPEMFEALSEVLKFHDDQIHDLNVWDMVRNAISKAKGELINE